MDNNTNISSNHRSIEQQYLITANLEQKKNIESDKSVLNDVSEKCKLLLNSLKKENNIFNNLLKNPKDLNEKNVQEIQNETKNAIENLYKSFIVFEQRHHSFNSEASDSIPVLEKKVEDLISSNQSASELKKEYENCCVIKDKLINELKIFQEEKKCLSVQLTEILNYLKENLKEKLDLKNLCNAIANLPLLKFEKILLGSPETLSMKFRLETEIPMNLISIEANLKNDITTQLDNFAKLDILQKKEKVSIKKQKNKIVENTYKEAVNVYKNYENNVFKKYYNFENNQINSSTYEIQRKIISFLNLSRQQILSSLGDFKQIDSGIKKIESSIEKIEIDILVQEPSKIEQDHYKGISDELPLDTIKNLYNNQCHPSIDMGHFHNKFRKDFSKAYEKIPPSEKYMEYYNKSSEILKPL